MKLKSGLLFALILSGAVLSANADTNTTNQNAAMTPPKPLDNKVYTAMVGTWVGNSEMMGKKMHDIMKIRWALNHQFLVMELQATRTDQPKMKYQGMGVFGIDAQGKAKTWWFDSWGAESVSTGTGTFSNNQLTLSDSNAMFSETRSFEVQGKQMTMHAKGEMTWEGKKMPFDVTTIYKKK